ncbi:DUF4365 domain-containing protein [Clostridium sp. LBM24168]
MEISQIKEELSINYIATVAAIAGIDYDIIRHDEDSTDGLLKKQMFPSNGGIFCASLRVQLKCTSSHSQYSDDGDTISYQLKAKNYNDLCAPGTIPIILGLLIIPENEKEWTKWSKEELMIKGCMYWLSLAGKDETANKANVTVKIDKHNVINSETLLQIFNKIAEEEDL